MTILLILDSKVYADIQKNVYPVDEKGYIYDIAEKTNVKDFKLSMQLAENDIVVNKQGENVTGTIGTGMKLKTSDGKEYTLVVRGDSSGDGEVSSTDILNVKQTAVGIRTQKDYDLYAIDLNDDGQITVTDVLNLKQYFVGIPVVILKEREIKFAKEEITINLATDPRVKKLTLNVIPISAEVKLRWSSSNNDIVEVDQDGVITCKAVGEAIITAETERGLKGTCKVTVTNEEGPEEENEITVTFVSDPNEYPFQIYSYDFENEGMPLTMQKTSTERVEGFMHKDIPQKIFVVPEGTALKEVMPKEKPEMWAGITVENCGETVIQQPDPTTISFSHWVAADLQGDKLSEDTYLENGNLIADVTFYAFYLYNNVWGKPVLYLYPTEETEISVKVAYPEKLTTTYPKYTEAGWKVLAEPDGTLTDLFTNRKLYCLYYEANNKTDNDFYKDGFIVKGEDVATFLEEKLEILGLNERESEEFIIYWLPRLEKNKYNYIRFAESEYINSNMPLEITPKPDNLIRVLMEFKALDEPIEVKEQQLTTPSRKGFTVVEWGGTEIGK